VRRLLSCRVRLLLQCCVPRPRAKSSLIYLPR
jgi:hypothetical protein